MAEYREPDYTQLTQGIIDTFDEPPEHSIHKSKVPLTGFLGVQRTKGGGGATVMNMSVNLGGQEWLVPLLTPNQDPADLEALLGGEELPDDQRRRIEDQAIAFALEWEKTHPGTFAKYNSVLAADTAARGESNAKGHIPTTPPVRPQYPGRP